MTVYSGRSMADGIETIEHLRKAIDGLDGNTTVSPTLKVTHFESIEPGKSHIEISEDNFDGEDL